MPGCAPGGAVTFCPRRQVTKERLPYCLRPFAARMGNLRRGVCGVRRRILCAAALRRSDNRGESVERCMSAFALMQPRKRPDAGATTRARTADSHTVDAALGRVSSSALRGRLWQSNIHYQKWLQRLFSVRWQLSNRMKTGQKSGLLRGPLHLPAPAWSIFWTRLSRLLLVSRCLAFQYRDASNTYYGRC